MFARSTLSHHRAPEQQRRRIACRGLLAVSLSVLFSSCALLPQPAIEAPTASAPEIPGAFFPGQLPEGGARYAVSASDVLIKTYRAGWLKSKAHAHVITTDRVAGYALVHPEPERSRGWFYFRPWDLVLDDPAVRAAAGPEFASHRSPADIAATRTRMLGPAGLDSNRYPYIEIAVFPAPGLDRATLQVLFQGRTVNLEAPMTWQREGRLLVVRTETSLSHAELGIRPYSAFAGAIAVADRIDFTATLTLVPAGED